ncbi:MAG: hypothetical protein IPJ98_13370 [Bryobacterales bacterium]|nr:hypothetical protein [Bryobacterales bacterium]
MRWMIAMLVVCLAAPVWAQDPLKEPEMKYFKLDFVVKELDETRTVSARTYSAMVATGRPSRGCSIRMGNRVPVQMERCEQREIPVSVLRRRRKH